MRTSGFVATYRGTEYPVQAWEEQDVYVPDEGVVAEQPVGEDVVRRVSGRLGPQARLRGAALDALERVTVEADWRGQRIKIVGAQGDVVRYEVRAPVEWLRENDGEGSMWDGMRGEAPVSELTWLEETRTSMRAAGRPGGGAA